MEPFQIVQDFSFSHSQTIITENGSNAKLLKIHILAYLQASLLSSFQLKDLIIVVNTKYNKYYFF